MKLSLEYKIKEPTVIRDKNPLLLLLHGYGSNEEDLFSFSAELPEDCYVVSARAPHVIQYNSYAWYAIHFDADENKFSDLDQARVSRDVIVNFVNELVANFAVDAEDVTLIGFSQGSILSYSVALSYPKKIRRVVAMSGYLNLELVVANYAETDFNRLHIFASHGTADQVIPVEWARKSKPALDALSIANVYKEYSIGHGVCPENFYDFKQWLAVTDLK